MKTLIITYLLLYSIGSKSQDVAIPDYRGDKESFEKLKDKTIRKEVATFTIAESAENISKIKLKEIPLSKFGANFSTFEKDSIKFKLSIGKFIKTKHKIKYIDTYAVKIDQKPFWGTDGGLPKEQIKSIQVTIGSDTVAIPKTAYNDLFEPSLRWKEFKETRGRLWIYYSKERTRFYITMGNSDGAGFYEATLIIKDKKYSGRVIDHGF